jgi:peptide/nickel transport system substrate-binding protein
MQHVFDTLVGRDAATGNLVPRLALSWEAPDPTTWVFKLRPGVKFHNGADFTSSNAKVSLDRIIAQKGPVAPLFAAVEAIEAPDPLTFRLKTRQPVGTIPVSTTLRSGVPQYRVVDLDDAGGGAQPGSTRRWPVRGSGTRSARPSGAQQGLARSGSALAPPAYNRQEEARSAGKRDRAR